MNLKLQKPLIGMIFKGTNADLRYAGRLDDKQGSNAFAFDDGES